MDNELRDRFIALETKFETWKESHDIHAEQRHNQNLSNFDKVFQWLEKLPCGERIGTINGIKKEAIAHRWLMGMILTVLGWLIILYIR